MRVCGILEIRAAFHASTTLPFWRKAAGNGLRQGNASGARLDGGLDIIPRTVQMNVITGILGASSFVRARWWTLSTTEAEFQTVKLGDACERVYCPIRQG